MSRYRRIFGFVAESHYCACAYGPGQFEFLRDNGFYFGFHPRNTDPKGEVVPRGLFQRFTIDDILVHMDQGTFFCVSCGIALAGNQTVTSKIAKAATTLVFDN